MAGHTPGPWALAEWPHERECMGAALPGTRAVVGADRISPCVVWGGLAESDANAEFIVRACNGNKLLDSGEGVRHGRLWSLWDMLRFYAGSFLMAFNNVLAIEAELPLHALGPRVADWDTVQRRLREALRDLLRECDRLPVSNTMSLQVERAANQLTVGTDAENHVAIARMTEIRKNLVSELSDRYFLAMAANRRALYEQRHPLFGEQVAAKFADANRDIAAAGRCLAVDEWTASVFHLMRVLEHGLYWLVTVLDLDADSARLENWRNVIDQVESAIRKLEAQPKSGQKSADMKFYSEAASQFRWFKDAWRNHVAHGRVTYDEQEATAIFAHVRDFMTVLATRA